MIQVPGLDIPNNMRVIYNGSDITFYAKCLDFEAHQPSSLLDPDPPRITTMKSMIMDTIEVCNIKQLIFVTLN